VIAAQSIGEPGTQLTMRTFHTGGVAGKDIAGGLPRVVELFEARHPRGSAFLARATGVVRIGEDDSKGLQVNVIDDSGAEVTTVLPMGSKLKVKDGESVVAGQLLTDVRSIRRNCWRSAVSAMRRPTSSTKCSACTAIKAWRFTTSTSN